MPPPAYLASLQQQGELRAVHNLAHWARSHAAIFGMDAGDASAVKIVVGFEAIKRSAAGKLRDKRGRFRRVYTYKGWQLSEPAESKEINNG